ncbi:MAG TPA: hypothetical protein VHT05_01865 [Candidatus Elarobacter sp.]|nr:hypothetical protein [Candidatus Elarobacter sp.]
MNDDQRDPRLFAIPDTHGHAKGEHKPFAEERPLPLTARMLFLWFYHACRRGYPRFLMVADHMNYLTFEDPAAVNLVRRALKLAEAGDLHGAADTAGVEVGHAAVVSEGLRRGMRYSIGAEVDNDPRSRPDAQNIVDAMRPDAIIRSVHFIPIAHPVHGENWPWPFDNPEFAEFHDTVGTEKLWETYVNTLVDVIERLPGHIVGHFFVPAVFGHWPDDKKLGEYEDRVLAAAEARQMAVEFNTRFLYRDHTDEEKQRYLDANRRFLRKAKLRGIGIAVGSDAHSPKDQAGAFDVVLQVLDELEVNEIVFPLAGSLRRVALRVVREPEPEPVPEPPPPEPVKAAREATDETVAAGKPVRKARTTPKPTRSAESSAERSPERGAPAPPAENTPPPPPEPKPARKAAAAEPAPAPDPKPAAKAPPAATPVPPVKPAATAKPEPAAKATAAKPAAAAKPVPPAKAVAAAKPKSGGGKPATASKAVPAKKAAPAAGKAKVKTAASKGAKAAPKRAAGAAAKRGTTAKKAVAKKPAAKKTVKKATAVRPAPKKAAPAKKKLSKKPVAKKTAPARKAPARKGSAAKKPTAKKTAPKRR